MITPTDPEMDSKEGGPIEVIRHAERLTASTVTRPLARAVLRKKVVTEQRTVTVEVRYEIAELELLPVPVEQQEMLRGTHAALPEVVLWEERIEIVRRLVPIERVRLQIQEVTTTQTVTGTVGHEVVEMATDEPNIRPTAAPSHL